MTNNSPSIEMKNISNMNMTTKLFIPSFKKDCIHSKYITMLAGEWKNVLKNNFLSCSKFLNLGVSHWYFLCMFKNFPLHRSMRYWTNIFYRLIANDNLSSSVWLHRIWKVEYALKMVHHISMWCLKTNTVGNVLYYHFDNVFKLIFSLTKCYSLQFRF